MFTLSCSIKWDDLKRSPVNSHCNYALSASEMTDDHFTVTQWLWSQMAMCSSCCKSSSQLTVPQSPMFCLRFFLVFFALSIYHSPNFLNNPTKQFLPTFFPQKIPVCSPLHTLHQTGRKTRVGFGCESTCSAHVGFGRKRKHRDTFGQRRPHRHQDYRPQRHHGSYNWNQLFD